MQLQFYNTLSLSISKHNFGQVHHKQIVRLVVIMNFDTSLEELDYDYLILLVLKDEI